MREPGARFNAENGDSIHMRRGNMADSENLVRNEKTRWRERKT
jgi:hypothetical protein